jgi:flavodoxin
MKILFLSYSQSGQANAIVQSFAKGFEGDTCVFEQIKPVQPFPFPWTTFQFFNAFPETFAQQKIELQPFSQPTTNDYDLIVFAYQPWFLTPSPAASSFLQSDVAKEIFKGKPVVTLIGCRNMWLGAQEKVKTHLLRLEGKLMGNIALVDRTDNVKSVITILRWMLTGKKDAFWFFPPAGVADADIRNMTNMGKMVHEALQQSTLDTLQTRLNEKGAIEVKPNLVLLEQRGQKAFGIWSKFIGNANPQSLQRKIRVGIFSFLLPTAVFILSPLLTILSAVLLRVNKAKLTAVANQFKQNGKVDFFKGN